MRNFIRLDMGVNRINKSVVILFLCCGCATANISREDMNLHERGGKTNMITQDIAQQTAVAFIDDIKIIMLTSGHLFEDSWEWFRFVDYFDRISVYIPDF